MRFDAFLELLNVTAKKAKAISVLGLMLLSFVTLCLHTATMMEPSLSLAQASGTGVLAV